MFVFVYLCIPICVFECVCLCIFELCEDELLCVGFMQRVNCGLMFLEILQLTVSLQLEVSRN